MIIKPKTKIDHTRKALDLLKSAGIELINASADLGTPEEIDDARSLVKYARRALKELLDRHGIPQ